MNSQLIDIIKNNKNQKENCSIIHFNLYEIIFQKTFIILNITLIVFV